MSARPSDLNLPLDNSQERLLRQWEEQVRDLLHAMDADDISIAHTENDFAGLTMVLSAESCSPDYPTRTVELTDRLRKLGGRWKVFPAPLFFLKPDFFKRRPIGELRIRLVGRAWP